MNLPNVLTMLRIFMVFIFVSLLPHEGLSFKVSALAIFIIASLTDFFDGYYARKYNLITSFGKIMDPIADKFLVLAAFYMFTLMVFIPIWMFVVIALRELLLTGLRLIAVRHGIVLAAEGMGKVKTVLQMGAIISFLIFLILIELVTKGRCPEIYALRVYLWSYTLMFFVVGITVFSGMAFLWNNRRNFQHVR
ncbi:CDP-diacylglycerol--glycerol-3-phosphate 3-phosphatidyltransferase [hydrothermal vent metagenome]|uniref:CDP-diacylglycerol--glycerol-3-phosphate 3-phosphatidyltransferase n=1 Tax=hydrothermal vent metagenome TaxID=652676 RepID=A0A3B1D2K8_9ZZZZ